MFKFNLRKLALMCIDAITIIIASIIAFIMLITMDAFGPGVQITDFQASIIIFAGVSVVCMYFTKVVKMEGEHLWLQITVAKVAVKVQKELMKERTE